MNIHWIERWADSANNKRRLQHNGCKEVSEQQIENWKA